MSTKTLRLSTPKGVAVYPALKRPDTKFDNNGIYKADVRIPTSEAEPLIEKLADVYKAHMGKAIDPDNNPLYIVDKDDGKPTGTVTFKLRVKNVMRKDGELWDRRPQLFDSELKPCDVDPKGGSVFKVSFDVWEYVKPQNGVKLQPVAVQILELQERGNQDPSAFGFEEEEGGFAQNSVDDLSTSLAEEEENADSEETADF